LPGSSKAFIENEAFKYLVMACNLLKDLVSFIIIIIINITLGILLKKIALDNSLNNQGMPTERVLNFKNGLIAFIMCSLSSLVHILTSTGLIIDILFREWTQSKKVSALVYLFAVVFNEIKYGINIIILYNLNKKFRQGLKHIKLK